MLDNLPQTILLCKDKMQLMHIFKIEL